MQNQKALEILKEAILLERRGKAFYLQASQNTKSEAAAEIFRMMAEEEDEHIKYLSVQFANYAKTSEFVKPDTSVNDEHDAVAMQVLTEKFKSQVDAASYEAAAIAAALDFEMRAVKVYSDRAKESTDIHEKQLYLVLADWEKGHHEMLKQLNEDIKESIWDDNGFWPY